MAAGGRGWVGRVVVVVVVVAGGVLVVCWWCAGVKEFGFDILTFLSVALILGESKHNV